MPDTRAGGLRQTPPPEWSITLCYEVAAITRISSALLLGIAVADYGGTTSTASSGGPGSRPRPTSTATYPVHFEGCCHVVGCPVAAACARRVVVQER